MYFLYIFALLIHAALTTTPCQDGVEIESKESKNPLDLIGNWTYVYYWDNNTRFDWEFKEETKVDKSGHLMNCPELSVSLATLDFVEDIEAECKGQSYPFDWSEGMYRLNAPIMGLENSIIFIGIKENWLLVNCLLKTRVVINKVSDDYIVFSYPDLFNISEMISRKAPTLNELKCIAHNVDIGKGMKGVGQCYVQSPPPVLGSHFKTVH